MIFMMKIWILESFDEKESYENKSFLDQAKKEDVDAYIVHAKDFEIIASKEGRKSMLHKGEEIELPDCLIPRRGSATNYFEFAVIRQLEKLGVFCLNGSQSVLFSKDKLASMQILAANNVPIPKTMLAKFPLDQDLIEREFEYPLVIKTVSGTEGRGVFLCESGQQLSDLVELIGESKDPNFNIILQEFISRSIGKDIRVITLGGRPVGAMLRIGANGSFKANYSKGGSVSKMEVDRAMEWLSVESAGLLGLELAGVDLLFDGENYKICEINSAPGFEGFESATGLNVPKSIIDYLKVRLSQ
jgi:RimK family alpha-L-glutamate ligase